MDEGWARLVLPSREEAEEYFAQFRQNRAVADPGAAEDEDVVQGMVDELHMVMKSVRFSEAALVRAPPSPPSLPPQISAPSPPLVQGKVDAAHGHEVRALL